MARPIKNNADYFSHDTDMRDDPKIKALRRRFNVEGYGLWCMLLESIADAENFRLTVDIEILAGDYGVDIELLWKVIHFCVKMGLLQTDDDINVIWSNTLDKRFAGLLSKRKRDRKQFPPAKTTQEGVVAIESTQSKVKESKERDTRAQQSICKVFGKDYKPPQDRMRAEANFYTTIDAEAENLLTVMTPEAIDAQVGAYIRYCRKCDRQLIGKPERVCETILSADWITLLGEPPPKDPYKEAAFDRENMKPIAWEQQYAFALRTDPNFRKYFGYENIHGNQAMGGHRTG